MLQSHHLMKTYHIDVAEFDKSTVIIFNNLQYDKA